MPKSSNGGQWSANLNKWATQSQKRIDAIFKESAQRVISVMQQRVPVDTGFCRASLVTSLTEMPKLLPDNVPPKDAAPGSFDADSFRVDTDIARMPSDGTLYVGYTAAYAQALEYGHSDKAPSGFVRLAAQQWPQIVKEVTAEAMKRAAA